MFVRPIKVNSSITALNRRQEWQMKLILLKKDTQ